MTPSVLCIIQVGFLSGVVYHEHVVNLRHERKCQPTAFQRCSNTELPNETSIHLEHASKRKEIMLHACAEDAQNRVDWLIWWWLMRRLGYTIDWLMSSYYSCSSIILNWSQSILNSIYHSFLIQKEFVTHLQFDWNSSLLENGTPWTEYNISQLTLVIFVFSLFQRQLLNPLQTLFHLHRFRPKAPSDAIHCCGFPALCTKFITETNYCM